jgi:hypothetical protein
MMQARWDTGVWERSMATPEGFWYHTRVQFDHTDAQGRVFYAHYFRLLDQARCAYWEALGFSEDDVRQIEHDTVRFLPTFGDSRKRNTRCKAYTPRREGPILSSRESRLHVLMSARTVQP